MKRPLMSQARTSHPPPGAHLPRVPGAFIADLIIVGHYPGIATHRVVRYGSPEDGKLTIFLPDCQCLRNMNMAIICCCDVRGAPGTMSMSAAAAIIDESSAGSPTPRQHQVPQQATFAPIDDARRRYPGRSIVVGDVWLSAGSPNSGRHCASPVIVTGARSVASHRSRVRRRRRVVVTWPCAASRSMPSGW